MGGGLFVVALLAFTVFPKKEVAYSTPTRERIPLFDGEFEAVVRVEEGWLKFGITFPGQSGDKPGVLTIYRIADKQSCGSSRVDMVGAFTLEWEDKTRVVTLGKADKVLWDLNDCSVRSGGLW